MRADSPQWIQMGPAATDLEQHALDLLRALLTDGGLQWAWSNLTFIDLNGRLAEVDVLLLTQSGLHLVELKGYHGRITGHQQEWTISRTNRVDEKVRNPLLATEGKAKRLRSLLQDVAKGVKGHVGVPWVNAVTVLHGNGCVVDLDPVATTGTYALDGAGVKGLPPFSAFLTAPATDIKNVVDLQRSKQLVALLKAAGFAATPKVRKAGQYVIDLKEQLAEGESWVDVRAEHPAFPGQHRRIRLYDLPVKAPAQQRAAIANTAKREYLLTNGLDHPGVVAATEYLDTESGPALVFPDDGGSRPLATWLADRVGEVSFDDRLALLRQVGEVVRYAHNKGVQHRSLGPTKVYVLDRPDQAPRITVRDWQTGRMDPLADATHAPPTALRGSTLAIDPTDLVGLVYLAPESQADHADPVALDVYSLGSLAYLLVTDRPPAETLAQLAERMVQGGLDPSADLDGVPESLVALLQRATNPSVVDRTPSVDAFLAELDAVERDLLEESHEPPAEATDPLDAQVGDVVGDWLVEERLGSGSTGLALLVSDGTKEGPRFVLKVAHDAHKAERLAAEAQTLSRLDSPRVVRLVQPPFDLAGRTCILLEDAGRPTLARRLRDTGALTLEQLEKFAADLFEAAEYLDRENVFHRDLKPDNVGIRPDPGDRRPRLVLFDFSLSHEPLDATGSGTAPYLDLFLGSVKGRASRRRYDSAAERFALAVTLFEMATGRLPEWGDGVSAPAAIEAEVTLVASMFDDAVGEGLVAFFARALARDAGARFSDLGEMAQAWQTVFRAIAVPADEAEQDEADREAAAAAAGPATPLTAAGLSVRTLSALQRLGAETVADVIALSGGRINSEPGLGVEVRREIQVRRREWTTRLTATTVEEDLPAAGHSVEDLLARLVPRPNGRNTPAVTLAKTLVGQTESAQLPAWPTWAEVATAAGTADQADTPGPDAAVALRAAWSRSTVVAGVREEVAALVAALGGIATPDEVARLLVNRHGSTATGEDRVAHARLLVRAAVETATADAPLAATRGRTPDAPVLLGLGDPDVDPDSGDVTEQLDVARSVAATVNDMLAQRPGVLGSAQSLRLVTDRPTATAPGMPDPARLLAVAVAISRTGALSTRGEVYPVGLAPAESVRAVLAGGLRYVTVDGLARRVATRFPAAAALPTRPELDALVAEAAPALHWRDGAYTRASGTASMLPTGTGLATAADLVEPDTDAADRRLTGSLTARSGLVLAVTPRHLDTAPAALAHRYGVRPVDVTALLLSAMRTVARDSKVDWTVVVRADAQPPASGDRRRLARLVQAALAQVWEPLMADPAPLLLTDLAPLARYGQTALLSPLTDLTVAKPAARWLLVPRRAAGAVPTLDGHPVPLAADGWIDLPAALLTAPASTPLTEAAP